MLYRNLFIALLVAGISGCSAYSDARDPNKIPSSTSYQHVIQAVNVPYEKAVSNFKTGYQKCAIDYKQADVVSVGGSSIGSKSYIGMKTTHHLEMQTSSKMMYQMRKDGYISILVNLEKDSAGNTKLAFHGPKEGAMSRMANAQTSPKPFVKWAEGENTACHGYQGLK